MSTTASTIPTVLFGAFDRHNVGDLLFPHVAAALLGTKKLMFAGLAEGDLRCYGGHTVSALGQLAAQLRDCPVNFIHAGGELLTCNTWQAAAMLLPQDEARKMIARLDTHPQTAMRWARRKLGVCALAPYTVHRNLFPQAVRVVYNAVGGVDFDNNDPDMREEVLHNLQSADAIGVRDRQTQSLLAAAGIQTRLLPDPAVMVAELFGARIHAHALAGDLAQIRQSFPQGYFAVQFSADFGDDETLEQIAAQLDQAVSATGYGVVFFRAGAAPWHDDLACYQRAASIMRTSSARIFTSLNLWDICALIACSRAFCGSSLHGRILAMAFALPRINFSHPAQAGRLTKQASYASTWDTPGMPVVTNVSHIALAIDTALAVDKDLCRQISMDLAACYRQEFDALCAGIQ